jgi:uncharacterized protein YbjT (DUF2867 family)
VDWEAKVKLIQAAKMMGIQRYIFFSIDKCEKHPEVPLMDIKRCTEIYLEESGLNYTTLRLCGFMQVRARLRAAPLPTPSPARWIQPRRSPPQPLVSAYAVPVLEEKGMYGSGDGTRIAYLDTQDIAKMTMAAVRCASSP